MPRYFTLFRSDCVFCIDINCADVAFFQHLFATKVDEFCFWFIHFEVYSIHPAFYIQHGWFYTCSDIWFIFKFEAFPNGNQVLMHSLWKGRHLVWIHVGHWIPLFLLVSSCHLCILWIFLVWDIVHTSIGLCCLFQTFCPGILSSKLWSSVSKAANRSRIMTAVMYLFSIPHSVSSLNLSRLVSHLKFFL